MATYGGVMTRKGQVTIPAEIRRSLGLREGDRVEFAQENGHVTIKPLGSFVERTRGIAQRYGNVPPLTEEELNEAIEQAHLEDVLERMERWNAR